MKTKRVGKTHKINIFYSFYFEMILTFLFVLGVLF